MKTPASNLTSAANNRLPRKDCLTGVHLRYIGYKFYITTALRTTLRAQR